MPDPRKSAGLSGRATAWTVNKSEAVAERGMLATKHPAASAAGVEILEAGGNAIDAAVAACLAVGVVEPPMSGLGGGGCMVIWSAGQAHAVAFPMQAPGAARPEMYALTGEPAVGVFGWAGVKGDANLAGPLSIAIPGAVAGLALALERFGTMPWAEVSRPAIRLARDGFPVGWFDAFTIAMSMDRIAAYGEAAKTFLPGGGAPKGNGVEAARLSQPDLARTLQALADAGPRDFYEGDVAQALAAGIAEAGGIVQREDLAQYRAAVLPPLSADYRGVTVYVPPFACAGPTSVETLNIYEGFEPDRLGHESAERLHAYICAAKLAFVDRFAYMADPTFVEVPWEGLASKDYARERRQRIEGAKGRAPKFEPGDPWRYQGAASRPASGGRGGPWEGTTHLCAADKHGNLVSLTNTLMAGFGSGIMPQGTGVVMNNGMMWFDPVPGRPNSIAAFKRGLNNMSPTVVTLRGRPYLAVGASGGRRITNAVTQIISNVVDHRMGVQAAIAAPRVDCSTDWVSIDDRFPEPVMAELRRRGHELRVLRQGFASGFALFAGPTAIIADEAAGVLRGGVDVYHGAEALGC